MNSGANTQSYTFSLGASYKTVLVLLTLAVIFGFLAPLPAQLIRREGPVLTPAQGMALLGGIFAYGIAAYSLIGAIGSLYAGLRHGDSVTIDADGVRLRTFWGGEKIARWGDALRIEVTERTERVATTQAPDVPHPGVDAVVSLLHALSAERQTLVIRGIRITSGAFSLTHEPEPRILRSLMRWLVSRQVEAEIRELGGSVSWKGDGFERVDLAGTGLTDTQFQSLAESLAILPQLHTLNLNHTRLTNASLPALGTCRRLRSIEAAGTELDLPSG